MGTIISGEGYRTLEEDLTECFKKRNIEVLELLVNVRKGEYKIKVKYPNIKVKKSSNSKNDYSITCIDCKIPFKLVGGRYICPKCGREISWW